MSRPRALDLFCGAGGAAMGLHRAGFDVTGIDNRPQPQYPFRFILGDALNPPVRLEDFDLVWASPPCQFHTPMSNRWRGQATLADARINLIPATRALLERSGLPYIVENVPGSEEFLQPTFRLRGCDFGLNVHRPRMFRTNFHVMLPSPLRPALGAVAVYGKADGRRLLTRADGTELRAWTLEEGRAAMGMPWADEDGVREAIPPAYAEHIGHYAMLAIKAGGAPPAESPE